MAGLAEQPRAQQRLLNLVADCQVTNVSEKVVRVILSYTDYLNRFVWRNTI